MKEISKDVKLKGEVVATVKIQQCENEADLNTWGLEKVLGLVNRQKVADECNAERGKYRETSPKAGKRLTQILGVLSRMTFSDGETGWDKLGAIQQIETEDERKDALDALLATPEVVEAMKS